MKISKPCYQIVFSKDEKDVYIVSGAVYKYAVGNIPVEIYRLNDYKYPSEICLSEDESILAIFTTEGYIAVYNASNGKLISNTKSIKQEGKGIFFLSGTNKVVCSTWDGNIVVFDYFSQKIDVISIPNVYGKSLVKTNDKNIYLFFCEEIKNDYIYQKIIMIDFKKGNWQEICNLGNITIGCNICSIGDNCYFIAEDSNNIISLFVYSLDQNKSIKLLSFPPKVAIENISHNILVVNKNENLILIELDKLYLIDIRQQKIISSYEIEYLSSATLYSNEQKLFIGTWTKGWSVFV